MLPFRQIHNRHKVVVTERSNTLTPVVTNQLGTVNNIIQVKKTDFEVFDAVMVDSQKCSDISDLSSSPPGPYHQDPTFPSRKDKSLPILSLHLLQVILNKHTGISEYKMTTTESKAS
ncbi:5'-AMP-activated protein kinase subunit beta-1-like [Salvelinus alpinus]|uniref:5'-AMP-activated protein kinase subunit beta-1-like n=1 Tax=Salvelinus alpinus TaxID=8036 RepID=UPI0039FCA171